MENFPVLSLEGSMYTDYSGIKQLFSFYNRASEHSNKTISIDLYGLDWIDANLCSILHSILYKLKIENNLQFSADLEFINKKFDILFRNGFINDGYTVDDRNSAIELKGFSSKDKAGFIEYISDDLLSHRGMPNLCEGIKEELLDALIELYTNVDIHAKTEHPLFVCGQYFPKKELIVFSMVDLGVGFLPAIKKKTNNRINTCFDSIKWALEKSNTTKENSPGGLGLYNLHKYCLENNGILQIITGNTYWSSDLVNTIFDYRTFESPYVGSIINLHFSCN